MYDLPPLNHKDIKNKARNVLHGRALKIILIIILFIIAFFYYADFFLVNYLHLDPGIVLRKIGNNITGLEQPSLGQKDIGQETGQKYVSQISYEQAVIDAVASASPSVVSIVISKNVPVYEQQFVNPFEGLGSPFEIQIPQNVQKGSEYQEVGAGSGFFVSQDGLILTNKHVISDKTADYTVVTNDGKKYSAKVLARDPVQDLAIIKIQQPSNQTAGVAAEKPQTFPAIKIGDSDGIQIGQGAIAIGNALGELSNTVSVGVVSGLGRNVAASGSGGFSENLEGIIQTDAAINLGNSGGPLINLRGEVIGINTATAQGAQSIGFAIPINIAKRDISQIIASNKITYPFLGVRYVLVDGKVKEKYHLSVDYGALVLKGDNGESPVAAGTAAAKAGIKEKDVILELDGQKVAINNSLQKMITQHNPGDTVTLKVLRDGTEISVEVTLGERE